MTLPVRIQYCDPEEDRDASTMGPEDPNGCSPFGSGIPGSPGSAALSRPDRARASHAFALSRPRGGRRCTKKSKASTPIGDRVLTDQVPEPIIGNDADSARLIDRQRGRSSGELASHRERLHPYRQGPRRWRTSYLTGDRDPVEPDPGQGDVHAQSAGMTPISSVTARKSGRAWRRCSASVRDDTSTRQACRGPGDRASRSDGLTGRARLNPALIA